MTMHPWTNPPICSFHLSAGESANGSEEVTRSLASQEHETNMARVVIDR